jgi:CubicO group peptidase (beta-lactamase class C family)
MFMTNKLDTIGAYIDEAMASWQIPGLALAVVKGDEIVHLQGYGVRDIETRTPITPNTLFAIASSTKAFTCVGYPRHPGENDLSSSPLVIMVQSIQNRNST